MATKWRSSLTSSPATFYTSKEESDGTNESTTASTPIDGRVCPHRRAGELSRELKVHCQIFLEEQLYVGAINLLNSMLGAGASKQRLSDRAVPVPPPTYLALLSTLVVHPLHTTRADKPEHLEISSLALAYLRNVLAMVGPLQADFRTAFRFHEPSRWSRRAAGHSGTHNSDSDSDNMDGDSDAESNPLRGRMANEGSLWAKGQDFWSTVGWAFNCCTSMPHRWRYWRAWLEFMLDVLDADWDERERLDEEAHAAGGGGGAGDVPVGARSESMMAMYMKGQTGAKDAIKALLVYGGSVSSAAFREVFEKEHRGPRPSTKKRKREQVLDLNNDKFGDYFDDESLSSGVSEPPTPQKPTAKRRDAEPLHPGMVESIGLRLRLFRLLSLATFTLGKRAELIRLYEEMGASIKLLPLDMYSLIVTQRPNALLLEAHITLTKELFHLLLPSSYRDPRKVDREGDLLGGLTMPMLEHCYTCHPANTVGAEDNAKLSLLVESAVQLLWMCDAMKFSEGFAGAVERGIEARDKKVQKKRTVRGRSGDDGADAHALAVLSASAERIRVLLDVLEASSAGD